MRALSHEKMYYDDVIMGAMASQITSLTIVYSTVYSDADQRKNQNSVSLAFVRGIHRGPVNSPHKWPVTRKMFPFDDVIMKIVCPWKIDLFAFQLFNINLDHRYIAFYWLYWNMLDTGVLDQIIENILVVRVWVLLEIAQYEQSI